MPTISVIDHFNQVLTEIREDLRKNQENGKSDHYVPKNLRVKFDQLTSLLTLIMDADPAKENLIKRD